MLTETIINLLNKQVRIEAESSQIYLAMASWAETKGLVGIATFMYTQAEEERVHMLKIFKFINERGGHAMVSELSAPKTSYKSFQQMFDDLFKHELFVSNSINELVHKCIEEKDHATHNFLQWYLTEQIEEESTARHILDKINMIGDDRGGLYLFDRDVQNMNLGGTPV